MQTFRYLPPGSEEQRAFAMQFLGTLLGLALIVVLWLRTGDGGQRAVLVGAGAGVLWMLGRSAWSLEKKAQRAQNAEIGVDDDGLHITDINSRTQLIQWTTINDVRVTGGRLTITWPGGKLAIGSREMENGMTLVREVTSRWAHRADANGGPPSSSNFIPLEPR